MQWRLTRDTGPDTFVLWRPPRDSQAEAARLQARLHMERALAATLTFFLALAWVLPRLGWEEDPVPLPVVYAPFRVQPIPQTRQGVPRPQPPVRLPAVPIEVEDEKIAADVTIDFPNVAFIDFPPLPEGFGMTEAAITMGPRLVKEVIPAITDRAKRRGARGTIRMSVHVAEDGRVLDVRVGANTTIVEIFRRDFMGGAADADRLLQVLAVVRGMAPRDATADQLFARFDGQVTAVLQQFRVERLEQARNAIRAGWDLSQTVEKAAIDAMYQCQYLPARQGADPVAVWAERTLTIDYSR